MCHCRFIVDNVVTAAAAATSADVGVVVGLLFLILPFGFGIRVQVYIRYMCIIQMYLYNVYMHVEWPYKKA